MSGEGLQYAIIDADCYKICNKDWRGDMKVAILGMAPSWVQAPIGKDWEIWRVNEAYKIDAHYKIDTETWTDRWFQLHQPWDFKRKLDVQGEYDHIDWLKQEHSFPIYMQEKFEEIPNSLEYPFSAICEYHGLSESTKYFTNSAAHMIAFALYLEATTIGLWGWELSSDTEMKYEKPSVEFWLGVAHGMGVQIALPKGSPLLGQRRRVYALEDVPAVNRMHIEIQRNRASHNLRDAQHELSIARNESSETPDDARAEIAGRVVYESGKVAALERLLDELDDVGDPRGERK
jgi:hypothetical protein